MRGLEENLPQIKAAINSMPDQVKELYGKTFSKKITRAANSSSAREQVCKVLFILFMLAESKGLPVLAQSLTILRNHFFKSIYIEGIYHTGYALNSTEPRPVFAIGPNIFSPSIDGESIYLPISHNLAFGFSVKKRKFYNSTLKIFSANPEKLNLTKKDQLELFKVSHDFIDSIVSEVLTGAISSSSTIYTPHELSNVEEYLSLQRKNEDFFYLPPHPERIM